VKRLSWRPLLVRSVLVSLCLAGALSAQIASHVPTAIARQESGSTVVTGKPVVRVNGVVMTDRDLLREMYSIFPYARQHNGFPKAMEPEIRKGALQMIVFEELVYQQALREKISVSDNEVSRSFLDFKKTFRSQTDYQDYLQAEAAGSERVVKNQIRRSLLIDAYLKTAVKDKSAVSIAEAREYYSRHPKLFANKEGFRFQSISIMPPESASPETIREARQRAEQALRQAKATKSYQEFGLLAEKVSEDNFRVNMGDHNIVDRDQLPPAFINAALAMKPGEVSNLIELDSAFTFFRLNSHVPAGTRTFNEAKDQLRKDLQKEKEDRLRIALDATLRKKAKVEEL
jgi:parvulin-like peptidyl-prolyl isomerase